MFNRAFRAAWSAACVLSLAACTTGSPPSSATQAQVAKVASVTASIAAGCQEALPLAMLAGAIPTIGPFVAAGVQVACRTDAGIAKLTADPSSAEWLGQQVEILKQAVGR